MDAGKIYASNGKAVLIFGVAEAPVYTGADLWSETGIGVDLETGKVSTIESGTEVYRFSDLSKSQLENFSHFFSIYNRMSRGIVTLSGKARSGKDTLADYLVENSPEDKDYSKTALGNPIKEICTVLYGNSAKKNREALIMIGQGLRAKEPHIWILTWLRHAIESFAYEESSKLVVTDVRQPNEFSFFKSLGALTVRIDADEVKRREMLTKVDGESALDDALLNDETESHVSTFDTDIVLFNTYDAFYTVSMESVLERLTNDEG